MTRPVDLATWSSSSSLAGFFTQCSMCRQCQCRGWVSILCAGYKILTDRKCGDDHSRTNIPWDFCVFAGGSISQDINIRHAQFPS